MPADIMAGTETCRSETMAKLILNIDREVVEQAKRLAAERNTNVSTIFSQFIRTLANRKRRAKPLGTLTRHVSGVIDLKGRSRRNIVADALKNKYKL
jgi:hypothetical protein